jgi:hypothetical protein
MVETSKSKQTSLFSSCSHNSTLSKMHYAVKGHHFQQHYQKWITKLRSDTSKLQTSKKHEQWQFIIQTQDMQVSATVYFLHCTDGKMIICI